MNECNNCAKRRYITKECPWGGTYRHRGEHGEHIGICNAYRKETNADRIRAMSDRELAELILDWQNHDLSGQWCKDERDCMDLDEDFACTHEMQKGCVMAWLKGAE